MDQIMSICFGLTRIDNWLRWSLLVKVINMPGTNTSRAKHDYAQLKCESNHFRYRPCRGVILRLPYGDEQLVSQAEYAAQLCGVSLTISLASVESDDNIIARLPVLAQQAEFLRTIEPVADSVLAAAQQADLNWINAPITSPRKCLNYATGYASKVSAKLAIAMGKSCRKCPARAFFGEICTYRC